MKKNNGKGYVINVIFALIIVAVTVVYLVVSAILDEGQTDDKQNVEVIKLSPDPALVPSGPPMVNDPTFPPPSKE